LNSPEHVAFRQSLRRFIEREIDPHIEEWEAARCYPGRSLYPKLAALGALGPSYPEDYGGGGGDYGFNYILSEELGGAAGLGVAMGVLVHTDMATPALAEHGSEELKQKFLVPAIAGEMISAIGVSEADAGSDVASLRTVAIAEGEHYVLNGSKMWITNGTQADFVVVLARTSPGSSHKGMSLLVVPTDLEGFSVSRQIEKMGNHCSDTGALTFENVRVPMAFRIGPEGEGFRLQMQQFQKERLVGVGMAIGGMDRCMKLTLEYCRERKTFGKPILANQYVQFTLAELRTEIELLRQMAHHCVALVNEGKDCTREVSMAKLKAGRLCREVADKCLQFHGGMGYAEEYPLARYFRDARLMSIGGGADEIMLGILCKMEGFV
jgi:citronellyl-CoA dehydrogenase